MHGISHNRLARLNKHHVDNVTPPQDQRGHHRNRPNSIPPDVVVQIDDFIKSIPTRVSHYSRKDQITKKYFTQDIGSISKLHRMFLKKYNENIAPSDEEVSLSLKTAPFMICLNFHRV